MRIILIAVVAVAIFFIGFFTNGFIHKESIQSTIGIGDATSLSGRFISIVSKEQAKGRIYREHSTEITFREGNKATTDIFLIPATFDYEIKGGYVYFTGNSGYPNTSFKIVDKATIVGIDGFATKDTFKKAKE